VRIAVFSDIHANRPALEAATRDAWEHNVDAFYFLGDLVGRGPDPEWCANYLKAQVGVRRAAWVAGNHDWMALERLDPPVAFGETSVGDVGKYDWLVIRRHRQVLIENAPQSLQDLADAPLLASPLPGVYLAHGLISNSARNIVGTYARHKTQAEDGYQAALALLPQLAAGAAVDGAEHAPPEFWLPIAADNCNHDTYAIHCIGAEWWSPRLVLVGHTHVARCWQRVHTQHGNHSGWLDRTHEMAATAQHTHETIWFENLATQPVWANPGSIGFARDTRVSQASYLLVDWQGDRVRLQLRRIPYDVGKVIARIEQLYPESAAYLVGLLRTA